MRELKFRIWDIEEKKMHYPDDIIMVDFTHQEVIVADYEIPEAGGIDFNRVVFMHCIGLKDKKMDDIYEGDIVYNKDEVYGERYGVVKWDNEMAKYIIESIGKASWYDYMGKLFEWEEVEVIGNIYENPELVRREET